MSAFNGGPAQTQSLNVPVGATPISTWANLPDPSTIPGLVYRVTDFGVAGVGLLVISDGARWVPLGPQILARSSVAVSLTGTTNETTAATVTVPGGLLGINGGLRVTALCSMTNNANSKTLKVKLGATFYNQAFTAIATNSIITVIRNRASAAVQIGGPTGASTGLGSSGNAAITGALDTSVDQPLTITQQLAVGTDTQTLEHYTVEVLP